MHNSLKERVLDAIDIVDVVGERVALKRKGKDFVGLCPFHPDHTPSMAVSPTKRIFKCWACGAGGDVIRFVERINRVSFREALESLARRANIEVRPATPAERQSSELREKIAPVMAWARDHFRNTLAAPAGIAGREYAQRRGLTAETLASHQLGLATDGWSDLLLASQRARIAPDLLTAAGLVVAGSTGNHYDRFRNRLIFPIHDPLGRPIAFGGRTLGDDPAKYLNSPETPLFSKSRVLFGLDLARREIESRRAAIVVEGYMDAVLLRQFGFAHVVATLGTALSDAHVKLLRPLCDRLYLCFDGDAAGVKAADRAVETSLRSRLDVRVVVLPDEQDPADCVLAGGSAAFDALLTAATDALEFKWDQTRRAIADRGPAGRLAAVEDLLDFIARTTSAGGVDPLAHGLLVSRLSELVALAPEQISDRLRSRRRRTQAVASAAGAAAPDVSAYDESTRGLPGGLVAAAEEVLGLLIRDCALLACVRDDLAEAMRYSRTWERLYGACLEMYADHGEYSMGDIVGQSEDTALCELVDRAAHRVREIASGETVFAASMDRLASELGVLRIHTIREELRAAPSAPQGGRNGFQQLLEAACEHDSWLPIERRAQASPA